MLDILPSCSTKLIQEYWRAELDHQEETDHRSPIRTEMAESNNADHGGIIVCSDAKSVRDHDVSRYSWNHDGLFTWPVRSAKGDEVSISTLQGMHSPRNRTSIRFDEIAIGQCYILGVYPPSFSKTSQATISYSSSRRVQVLQSYQLMPALRTSTNTSTLLGAPYHHTIRSRPPSKTAPYG